MVAPSRKRYEQTHPVISIRVDQELYEKLRQLRETGYSSYADILRVAAGIHLVESKIAYDKGFADAKQKYAINYPCTRCREPITVQSDNEKAVCVKALSLWGHSKCLG